MSRNNPASIVGASVAVVPTASAVERGSTSSGFEAALADVAAVARADRTAASDRAKQSTGSASSRVEAKPRVEHSSMTSSRSARRGAAGAQENRASSPVAVALASRNTVTARPAARIELNSGEAAERADESGRPSQEPRRARARGLRRADSEDASASMHGPQAVPVASRADTARKSSASEVATTPGGRDAPAAASSAPRLPGARAAGVVSDASTLVTVERVGYSGAERALAGVRLRPGATAGGVRALGGSVEAMLMAAGWSDIGAAPSEVSLAASDLRADDNGGSVDGTSELGAGDPDAASGPGRDAPAGAPLEAGRGEDSDMSGGGEAGFSAAHAQAAMAATSTGRAGAFVAPSGVAGAQLLDPSGAEARAATVAALADAGAVVPDSMTLAVADSLGDWRLSIDRRAQGLSVVVSGDAAFAAAVGGAEADIRHALARAGEAVASVTVRSEPASAKDGARAASEHAAGAGADGHASHGAARDGGDGRSADRSAYRADKPAAPSRSPSSSGPRRAGAILDRLA